MKHLEKHLENAFSHLAGASAHKLVPSCEAQPPVPYADAAVRQHSQQLPPHSKQWEESELFPPKQGFKHSIARVVWCFS